jgi:hypothetical protein
MGFKRVRDPNINEIVLATYVESIGKGNIFLIYFKYINIFSLYICTDLCQ